jgi:hypothetical protein
MEVGNVYNGAQTGLMVEILSAETADLEIHTSMIPE